MIYLSCASNAAASLYVFRLDISSLCLLYLLRDPGNGEPPLKAEGLSPGGKGEICGRGNEDGGSGTCGLGPGNME